MKLTLVHTVAAMTLSLTLASALQGQVTERVLQEKAGEPLPGLSKDLGEVAAYLQGKLEYQRVLEKDDGLGPIFNARSCSACHGTDGGEIGANTVTQFGLFTRESGNFNPLEAFGGPVLQVEILDDCALDANTIVVAGPHQPIAHAHLARQIDGPAPLDVFHNTAATRLLGGLLD